MDESAQGRQHTGRKSFAAAFMLDGGQNAALNWLIAHHTPVIIFLISGVKFEGWIEACDQYTIRIMDIKHRQQLIYKDKISTLMQKRPVSENNPAQPAPFNPSNQS